MFDTLEYEEIERLYQLCGSFFFFLFFVKHFVNSVKRKCCVGKVYYYLIVFQSSISYGLFFLWFSLIRFEQIQKETTGDLAR